ncbi:MAG: heparinase II/III domain-containing protein [Pseudomonas proteolytica]|uniref:heparinase II/III domain-containing protein n=1 Tax=Pseudomonas proteolytica TaxID=219574 RepID=UPI003F2B1612
MKKTTLARDSRPEHDCPDRQLESSLHFTNQVCGANYYALEASAFKGNARTRVTAHGLGFLFHEDKKTHQIRFSLPNPYLANGLTIRFRVSNWQSLKYMAIGFNSPEGYQHVKLPNAAINQWIDFSMGLGDLIFGIQNDWQPAADLMVSQVKIFFKGQPLPEGSELEVEHIVCWREYTPPQWLSALEHSKTPRLPAVFIDKLHAYFEKCFSHCERQVQAFLSQGNCPLYGDVSLPWPAHHRLPEGLTTVGTYRFSWHALHPAAMLMVYARNHEDLAAVFCAREFIGNWLEHSYFTDDADKKYAWYDHGTAERMLAFILMWDLGAQHNFDQRFMSRLRNAMFRHAQLLACEAFYASHQLTRYHNHAWFQDTALLAAALAMPELPCAQSWGCTAQARLEDQLDNLIIRDNGYSVFIENSIGYHQGVQRLIAFAGDLAVLNDKNSRIAAIADELTRFSALLKYPDNRTPAQGDTFRKANPARATSAPYSNNSVEILPKAGYAVIKSNHQRHAYMLCLFATSLCQTHKHEDNLSFTLYMEGIEWLIDPSFHSHEYKKPLEAFLRSAWAHNNVVIKGAHYSIEPGLAQLSGARENSTYYIHGSHCAYHGYTVSRFIEGALDVLDFRITDTVTGDGDTEAFSLFHCGDGVIVTPIEQGVQLSHPLATCRLDILSSSHFTVISGWDPSADLNATAGLGFMRAQATAVVAFRIPLPGHSTFQITASSNGLTP